MLAGDRESNDMPSYVPGRTGLGIAVLHIATSCTVKRVSDSTACNAVLQRLPVLE